MEKDQSHKLLREWISQNNYGGAPKSYLRIRSITDRSNYVPNIYPVYNTSSSNVPYTDFAVNGSSDEAIVV
jgi:hypothetical protein